MVESRYNIVLNNHPKKDYKTIYNLLTEKYICVHHSVDLCNAPDKTMKKMQNFGILVQNHAADLNCALKKYYDRVEKKVIELTYLLTGKCNCKCIYCYQQGTILPELSGKDVTKSIENVKGLVLRNNIGDVNIVFYGGEPMLKPSLIDEIIEEYNNQMGTTCNLKFSIITNGTIPLDKYIDKWLSNGLKSIKITLDGSRKIHNERRPYKNGQGTYDDILNNMKFISSKVETVVNIVIDETTDDLYSLITDIRHMGLNVTFDLSLKEPASCTQRERAQILIKHSETLKTSGVVQHSAISVSHGAVCMNKQLYTYVISGEGLIFGCHGNLTKPINDIGELSEKAVVNISKSKCKQCCFLPICYGNCTYHNLCEYEFLSLVVPELLRNYIIENKVVHD